MVLREIVGAGIASAAMVLLIGAVLGFVGPRMTGTAGIDDWPSDGEAFSVPPTSSLPIGPLHPVVPGTAGEAGFSLPATVGPAAPVAFDHIQRIARGDTLSGLLQRVGVSAGEARQVVTALRPLYDPRKLRAGQEIILSLQPAGDTLAPQLGRLSFAVDFPYQLVVARDAEGSFAASRTELEFEKVVSDASGIIRSSLFADGADAGVPNRILAETLRVFAWDVDFQRDIRKGDRFAMIYERFVDAQGETVRGGGLIAATLVLGGTTKTLYRFETADGRTEYFTKDGRSARKALLRTPIDGARLSSGYGMRRHPILGYSKMHKGVDFAAPRGTPIYAAGDGVVDFVGRRGGYGKYIRLRHRSGYATAYAHMSRYARGIRKGRRVEQGQVIAYVGSTGRSTGPHLHYEIIKNGRHINPSKVRMLPGPKLAGAELKRFRAEIAPLQARLFAHLGGAGDPVVASIGGERTN